MSDINTRIVLYPDPETGVHLPFIDIRLVQGRMELPDRVISHVPGEMDGQPCLIQLAYWRWPGPTDWVEQTATAGQEGDSLPPELDDLLDFPHGIDYDTAVYAPSPIFVRRSRPISSQIVETAVLVWGLTLTLCGIVVALNWLWRILRGG